MTRRDLEQKLLYVREEIVNTKAMLACIDNYSRSTSLRIDRLGPHGHYVDRIAALKSVRADMLDALNKLEACLPENQFLAEDTTPVHFPDA